MGDQSYILCQSDRPFDCAYCFVFYIHFILFFFFFPDDLRDLTLPATATSTNITNLTPDVDYSVSISSYDGVDESIPIFGQLTSKNQDCTILLDYLFIIGACKIGRLH